MGTGFFQQGIDARQQVMELFARVAHEQGVGVVVVTHDHRSLSVFDTIYEMEDGLMRKGEKAERC